jgi:hypothetical protein
MDREQAIHTIINAWIDYCIINKGSGPDQEDVLTALQDLRNGSDMFLASKFKKWVGRDMPTLTEIKLEIKSCTCGAKHDRDFPNRHYSYCELDKK